MKLLLAGLVLSNPLAWASASLTLTAPTVSSDGITITDTIGGCSTPLSPASGITGFTVTVVQDASPNFPTISSATRSGCVVTITLSEPLMVPSDASSFLTLATSPTSNLTDASGNTPSASGNTNVSINTSASTWYAIGGAAFQAAARTQGGATLNDTYHQDAHFQTADGFVDFNACATDLDFFTFDFKNHYVVTQDGVDIRDYGVSGSGTTFSIRGLISGLGGGCHEYRLIQINSDDVAVGFSLAYRVRVVGTFGSRPAARTVIGECGDSLVSLAGSQKPADSRTGHMWLSTYPLGGVSQHPGAAGAQVSGGGGLATTCPANLVNFGSTPIVDYLRGGNNDALAAVSLPTFRAAADSYIAGVKANALPPTNIVVIGLIQIAAYYPLSTVNTYNAQWQAAAAAANVTFVDPSLWIDGAANRQSDNIHLNSTGEQVFANRLIPISAGFLLGSSYTVSGPSTGLTGVPSTSFTLTLRGSATFVADSDSVARQTITLNDGGAGGTFTTSVGPTGTGPLAVTASSGTSWTFTYTPASVGTKTISFAASQAGWTNPANLSYTANANTSGGASIGQFTRIGANTRVQ